ncbi:Hypothetical predicted protein [Mytilus galloprovincialis]|uniref:Tc1-like transposase DDE domain-containing protein n=1 Tax=Mytilus galloprovincialis TaxID=29158 RepID=A0A8B6DGZ6_MYTGA|nr:Hypothetical predicted protein [Mytilus galloprovincialis]
MARLKWTRARIRWNRQTWRQVLFTDESKFNLKFIDGRARVYRRRNERFSDACVQETDRFGGGGIMVWGGITYQERTELKIIVSNQNATRYRDEILAPVVLPFLRRHRLTTFFSRTMPIVTWHTFR